MFASFLVFIGLFTGVSATILSSNDAYAVNEGNNNSQTMDESTGNEANNDNNTTETNERTETESQNDDNNTNNESDDSSGNGDNCKKNLGALGWLVCPTTGKISEAVDWLYDKIEEFLVVSPISTEDGSPIYEIWKYCRGVTNIVFIIFLLVVIYSQLTGLGISNYGIKKSLPKLIVTVILVNLSFLICSLAVDVSNILGSSLRGLFTSVEESTLATGTSGVGPVSLSSVFSALTGGGVLALGAGIVAFEAGMIWMLIPVVLGAIVAVVTGLITIALRQAVVALLIMVAPLAMVANMLPNTEQWFRKWKDLLTKMLIFYPMFSLLFGASSLAGLAIIMSAKDGFGLMLGIAVQIFPLFFAWSLMKMSGTILGTINSKLNGISSGVVAGARNEAAARRALTQKKNLLRKPYTPSLKLMQFMNEQRAIRDEKMSKYDEAIRNRALAKYSLSHYNKDGSISKKGEEDYEMQKRNLRYQQVIAMDSNNFNKGLSGWSSEYKSTIAGMKRDFNRSSGVFSPKIQGVKLEDRLLNLDKDTVRASDELKMELARGEKIEYDNAKGFHERMEAAYNAHVDKEHEHERWRWENDEDGNRVRVSQRTGYKFHMDPSKLANSEELARFNAASQIMDGNLADVQYAVATSAQSYDTQSKMYQTKMQKFNEMIAPTQDVVNRLDELTSQAKPADNIDAIISGMRVLNQRGDMKLLRQQLENVLNSEQGIELGTHASQALASFLMFEVKDNEPFLRRFGKFINLETAHVFNPPKDGDLNKMRKNRRLSLNEYLTGELDDWEEEDWEAEKRPDGTLIRTRKAAAKYLKPKRAMDVLIEGTSLDNVEREAYEDLDEMLMNAYKDENGNLDWDSFSKRREKIETAMGPAFISASLKYLSGSEQMKNAVKFLTGFDDGKGRWEEGGDLAGNANAEAYFRRKSLQYFKDQTPSQILSLRSDYKLPLMKHLTKQYLSEPPIDDEESRSKAEYGRKMRELTARYANVRNRDDARKMIDSDKEIEKLRMDMAGKQLRKLLDETGKLEQIYRTRRSGAANNAKDWMRTWLDLDNEVAITKKLGENRKRQQEEDRRNSTGSDSPVNGGGSGVIYDETTRNGFVLDVDNLWYDLRDEDDDSFFEESLQYVKDHIGRESYIAAEYERFHREDPYADGYMLKEFLMSLLNDPDSY